MVSIRQLRYFDAVARLGAFGKAAEHCAVSQPALSMQIAELERDLGVKLFERGPRGVRLTDDGREAARRAARVLAEVRDLGDFGRARAGVLTGSMRLGVIPSIAPYLLPPLLPIVRRRYPSLDLHLRETQTRQLLAELSDGTLDLLVLALPVEEAEFETLELFRDPFLLALPKSRRLKGKVAVIDDLMQSDRLLLLEEGHCLRDQALAFCRLRQVDSIDTFGASSLSTLVQMVANGLGLTLLPEISAAQESRAAGIRLMRFAEPEPFRTVGLAWRPTSPRRPDFLEFGRLLVEALPTALRKPMVGATSGN